MGKSVFGDGLGDKDRQAAVVFWGSEYKGGGGRGGDGMWVDEGRRRETAVSEH